MKRPASVLEILAALGFGAAATLSTAGLTACVGNPSPTFEDAGTNEDAPAATDSGEETDGGNTP